MKNSILWTVIIPWHISIKIHQALMYHPQVIKKKIDKACCLPQDTVLPDYETTQFSVLSSLFLIFIHTVSLIQCLISGLLSKHYENETHTSKLKKKRKTDFLSQSF
jgi:hypothetical protein